MKSRCIKCKELFNGLNDTCSSCRPKKKSGKSSTPKKRPEYKKAYDSTYYRSLRKHLKEFYYECQYPGCTRRALSIEHIVPLVEGGTNDPSNLTFYCPHHNYSKGAKLGNQRRGYRYG